VVSDLDPLNMWLGVQFLTYAYKPTYTKFSQIFNFKKIDSNQAKVDLNHMCSNEKINNHARDGISHEIFTKIVLIYISFFYITSFDQFFLYKATTNK